MIDKFNNHNYFIYVIITEINKEIIYYVILFKLYKYNIFILYTMYLNDIWSFYFHDPYDTDWTMEGFSLISNISNVDDFISIFECFKDILSKGMFFMMREHISPIWEDEFNKEGGCFSYKLYSDNFLEKFFEILALMIGENLGITNNISSNINGISICPKKNYYIVRIWIKNSEYAIKENYNINIPKYTTILYKKHNQI